MNELLHKLLQHQAIAGAVSCALLAVIIGTRPNKVGWRDYVLIALAALLTSAAVVDYWFANRGFFVCCLIGFVIGYLADDVMTNLNVALPEFIRAMVQDVLDWLRKWLARVLNK